VAFNHLNNKSLKQKLEKVKFNITTIFLTKKKEKTDGKYIHPNARANGIRSEKPKCHD
jgi:hypothetical protein